VWKCRWLANLPTLQSSAFSPQQNPLEKSEGSQGFGKAKGSRSQGFEGSSGSLGNVILKIKKSFESQRGVEWKKIEDWKRQKTGGLEV